MLCGTHYYYVPTTHHTTKCSWRPLSGRHANLSNWPHTVLRSGRSKGAHYWYPKTGQPWCHKLAPFSKATCNVLATITVSTVQAYTSLSVSQLIYYKHYNNSLWWWSLFDSAANHHRFLYETTSCMVTISFVLCLITSRCCMNTHDNMKWTH